MIEENSIFLAGGDALVYLGESMHKKYSTKLFWSHPCSTYVSYDRFFNSLSLVHTCTPFYDLPSIPLVAYVLNGWPISQSKNT